MMRQGTRNWSCWVVARSLFSQHSGELRPVRPSLAFTRLRQSRHGCSSFVRPGVPPMVVLARRTAAVVVVGGDVARVAEAQQCCAGNVLRDCTDRTSAQGCVPQISGAGSLSMNAGSGSRYSRRTRNKRTPRCQSSILPQGRSGPRRRAKACRFPLR